MGNLGDDPAITRFNFHFVSGAESGIFLFSSTPPDCTTANALALFWASFIGLGWQGIDSTAPEALRR